MWFLARVVSSAIACDDNSCLVGITLQSELHIPVEVGGTYLIRIGGYFGDTGPGMMTIQCFLTPADEIVFIEINARFGGGVPLSIRAGADSPRWILELLLGREPSISMDGWTDGMLMLRYDRGIFVLSEDLAQRANAAKGLTSELGR